MREVKLSVTDEGDLRVSIGPDAAIVSRYDVCRSLLNGTHSLYLPDVIGIKAKLAAGGLKYGTIAKMYGVSWRTVFRIANEETFGHIKIIRP